MSKEIDSKLLQDLHVNPAKLYQNLEKLEEDERKHVKAILGTLLKKRKSGGLPYKKDFQGRLGVTHGVITGVLKAYATARILKERRVGRYYQYDVHKDVSSGGA